MQYSYEDIKETLKTDVTYYHENYITKALNEFGYDSFPESGLNDKGKNKLINKVIEISESEASLQQKGIKKIKKTSENLESILIKDLKKVGEIAYKVITYLPAAIMAAPTTVRRSLEGYYGEDNGLMISALTAGMFSAATLSSYLCLGVETPELIPYVLISQLTTNAVSGIYEWIKSAKKKSEK